MGPWLAALAAGILLCVAPVANAQDDLTGKKPAATKPADKPAKPAPKSSDKAAKPEKAPLTAEQKEKIAAEQAAAKAAAEARAADRAAKREAQQAAAAKAEAERKEKKAARRAALDAAKEAQKLKKANDTSTAKRAAAKDAKDDVPLEGLLRHFYDELKPHGTWSEHPVYGFVWTPSEKEVGKSFAPYQTDGRWAVTEKGDWAWVSDEDWGNIPFHYGRWIWTREKSWAWIPDREYAPAWVVWRVGDPGTPYVGWAPMAPTHYLVDGVEQRQEGGVLPFYFVAARHLFSPKLPEHVIDNRELGKRVQEQSSILTAHMAKDGDSPAKGTLSPASPTFDLAHIPPFAIPKTRLPIDADAIKPIVLAVLGSLQPELGNAQPKQAEPKKGAKQEQEGRFATPPRGDQPEGWQEQPETDDGPDAQADDAIRADEPTGKANDKPSAQDAEGSKKRLVLRRSGKPRYRCWWTNTRPRIWRCGY